MCDCKEQIGIKNCCNFERMDNLIRIFLCYDIPIVVLEDLLFDTKGKDLNQNGMN